MALFKNSKEEVNFLELTPFPNYEYSEKEDGNVDVLVPKFTDPFFGKLLQPRLKNKFIRANLDEFGSSTWKLIDGSRSVYDIAQELDKEYGERIAPLYDRLTIFLTQLHRNGFINFIELKKGKKNG